MEVGKWSPALLNQGRLMEFELSEKFEVFSGEELNLNLIYNRGAHALDIFKVSLLENGKVIAEDAHQGLTGSTHKDNTYKFMVPDLKDGAKYSIQVEGSGNGGNDSHGTISAAVVSTKQIDDEHTRK